MCARPFCIRGIDISSRLKSTRPDQPDCRDNSDERTEEQPERDFRITVATKDEGMPIALPSPTIPKGICATMSQEPREHPMGG